MSAHFDVGKLADFCQGLNPYLCMDKFNNNVRSFITVPVQHKAMKVAACFRITLTLGRERREKICSRKSYGVTAERSHLSFPSTRISQS